MNPDVAAEAIETATQVLMKCAANDPWFPAGGDGIQLAWAEVFAESGLAREDLLAGVARAYRLETEGFKPLPAAIVKYAKEAYYDSLKSLPEAKREAMEEASHILQELGLTPPQAHRYARRIALGRKPLVALTPEQDSQLRIRLAERQALKALPARKRFLMGIVGEFGQSPQPNPDGASTTRTAPGIDLQEQDHS
ncbi:hypothetical protein R3Q06_11180 [Rhodococcus erythropolis]|uniref:hypothetical protein n=1 Tax=Rhodococcus erythropolis TaxID=1833 RepID=UPI00294A6EC8|nr:hypothetical protein [Rhodococcus erythropolis]MDV6274062.1 hypothetical protein [Rhodococcus erythropolis]